MSDFHILLPGQLFVLQAADFDDDPEHGFPPNCGDGELHALYLYLVPPPQDRLQAPYEPHPLQPP